MLHWYSADLSVNNTTGCSEGRDVVVWHTGSPPCLKWTAWLLQWSDMSTEKNVEWNLLIKSQGTISTQKSLVNVTEHILTWTLLTFINCSNRNTQVTFTRGLWFCHYVLLTTPRSFLLRLAFTLNHSVTLNHLTNIYTASEENKISEHNILNILLRQIFFHHSGKS